jgi:hypothetical protein
MHEIMKTKITLFIGAVALVTLSFTFANVKTPHNSPVQATTKSAISAPVGGIVSDEVVK